MKKCPKCKELLTGDHLIFYYEGEAGGHRWYCTNCEHQWD